MTFTRIATGDALWVLRQLPSESVHAAITSPPYWRLRDYEIDGQIGLEATPEEYVDRLLPIFDELWRVLRKDGTCWVVLGDTYVGKCLAFIPGRFGSAMTAHKWICRNKCIWHKPNATPASVADRFTANYEEVFFFTKNTRYYFEQQFVPYKASTWNRIRGFARNGEKFDKARHKNYNGQGSMATLERLAHKNLHVPGQAVHSMHRKRANGEGEPALRAQGANMRAVWTIPVGCCKEFHFAIYPEKLVEIAVRAGCPEGGIVIDSFSGAGTTGIVCERLGRSYLGIELNPAYVEIAERRIRKARETGHGQAGARVGE
jgi:site-specific DNA-methyltransferase (adenine-specific)